MSARIRMRAAAVALAVLSVLGALLVAPAASAAGSGSIVGTVVDGAGIGVSDVSVEVSRVGGGDVDPVLTSDGSYAVTGLAAGEYRVHFNTAGAGDELLSEYYDGERVADDATTVTVVDGVATTADASLQAAASISGTVLSEDTLGPVEGVTVAVYVARGAGEALVADTTTDSDGRYTLDELWPGTYRLAVEPSDPGYGWGSIPGVVLGEGEHRAGDDVTLTAAGFIAGTVTGPTGDPLPQTHVYVYPEGRTTWVASAIANDGGEYSVVGLDNGTYDVEFVGPYDSGFATTWWEGASNRSGATSIDIFNSSAASIDAQLEAAVSGDVSNVFGPIGGVLVRAFSDCASDTPMAQGWTDADGKYQLVGLEPGSYRVLFGAASEDQDWPPSWFGGGPTCSWAELVEFDALTPVNGIDAYLGRGFSVRVEGQSKAQLSGVSVQAYRLTSSGAEAVPQSGNTDTYGYYAFGGMPKGKYRLDIGATRTPGNYLPTSTTITLPATALPTVVVTLALKPVTVSTPKISGTPRVGVKLTASAAPSGVTYAYAWFADGKTIAKATARTFTPTATQRGARITVRVTASKTGFASARKTSAATAKVATGILTTATPKISGTVKVGKKLTAKPGTWTSGTAFTYRWYANGTAIGKATSSTYTIATSVKGKRITVKVTGRKSGYTTVTRTSPATAKVG